MAIRIIIVAGGLLLLGQIFLQRRREREIASGQSQLLPGVFGGPQEPFPIFGPGFFAPELTTPQVVPGIPGSPITIPS